MLKAGVLKPIQDATLWINSFVLVEGTDQQGKPKLRICLDATNLNKAIIQEPYHFKTPEDISHLLANATVLTVLDCKKGIGIKNLIRCHPILLHLILNLADTNIL